MYRLKPAEIYIHTCSLLLRFFAVFVLCCISCIEKNACAAALDLDVALQNTYRACVGIDDSLSELKKLAGINTAVTAVGTATGASATIVGLVKASKDKRIEELKKKLEPLGEAIANNTVSVPDRNELLAGLESYHNTNQDNATDSESEIEKLEKQSKSLGNWRTGLMAGATATNIAGAAISGVSLKKNGIQEQIKDCDNNVSQLRTAIARAKMEGLDVSEAQTIVNACSGYKGEDVSKIEKQAKGSLISSIVGSATGVVGTATSAAANSSKVRDDDSASGMQKEKNLNTASNVLAGATTAASATATVFNALQISTIKRVAKTAAECEGALK